MGHEGDIPPDLESSPGEDSLLREIARAPSRPPPGLESEPGEVLVDRFEIERFAGSGGMGSVYRALDRVTGKPVAVKLVTGSDGENERFTREARVLAELADPAIVRYVAHGTTPAGQPFLAMEWLEGEDLAKRLARTGLPVGESLAVVGRVAEGLAAAHAVGVVHRDVKPSNILLVSGDPAQAKLIDFGISRIALSRATSAPAITQTGVILGTIGYMSPEQATADRSLDARTDVFALGCVLFECLTGEPAFSGEHVVAVLAKVLREEAPRVRQFRPDLPPPLDELVARMLSKDKAGRVPDGSAVLRELQALGTVAGGVPRGGRPVVSGFSVGEQRLVLVMLALVPDESERLEDVVRCHGGEVVRLANSVLLVTFGRRGATSGEIVTAAACALELCESFPSARIALATGRSQTPSGDPHGPVIDQAAALLSKSSSAGIRIDELTAGLLGARFDVRPTAMGRVLVGRQSDIEPPRTLLGKPTPCVGRGKELTLLDGTLRESIDDSVARAMLITGPPGQGKSRLRHEFVGMARELKDLTILTARADPVGAGSAFVLVRQLVRRAVGLREGDPAAGQRGPLRAHVARVCEGADSDRIADFLGEIVGLPPPERPSPQLRAARNDPQIMAVWLGRSFGDWLQAECEARPVLIVLDDLQWGDLPSVTYLDAALLALSARPLMVLAFARPDVHDVFPSLWARAEKMEIALGRLTPNAAEGLVRAVLGDLPSKAIARIVEGADGNAFYLEELIRRVSEGESDSLPETVLALVQSRLERLPPEARRIARAASVFGGVFWRSGVAAILGVADGYRDLDAWLKTLAQQEVVTTASESRFWGEDEYAFRHALLREAAYAMVTPADLRTGHKLAGQWLAKVGERDALKVANHFERGGEPKLAVPWLLSAAQTAFEGGNVAAAITLAERGLAVGPSDAERANLLATQAQGLGLTGDFRGAMDRAREAMRLHPRGSAPWFRMAANALLAATLLGDSGTIASILREILDASLQPEVSGPHGLATYCASTALSRVGQLGLAHSFLARAEAVAADALEADPAFTLWLHATRGYLQLITGELGSALASFAHARTLSERTGHTVGKTMATHHMLQAMVQVGNHDRARTLSRELGQICAPLGMSYLIDYGTYATARLALMAHRAPEAIVALRSLLDRQDITIASRAQAHLAHALLAVGELDAATREANAAMEKGSMFSDVQAIALGALALISLGSDRPADALVFADRGLQASAYASEESILRLTRVEALRALGSAQEAHAALRDALERVHRIAAAIDDPELRESYLANIDANARTVSLAADWLGREGSVSA
jgi:eukaryotic-like serine/threonine-protein kinase